MEASCDGVLRALPITATDGALDRQAHICVREVQYTDESVARGVFALKPLKAKALVECAHCIHVPKSEYEEHVKRTTFEHYVFNCRKRGGVLLCLGLGSLFNHSDNPNLDYRIDEDALVIRFYAAKPIAAEEELTIFYGSNLWFTDPNEEARPSSPPETEDNVFANLSL